MWCREIGNYNASPLKLEHIRLFGYLQRLKVLVERVLEELTSDVNMGGCVVLSLDPTTKHFLLRSAAFDITNLK